MHLSTFETSINPIILQRGDHYFAQGNVLDVNEGKNGRWYARVEGTEEYRVEVSLGNGEVLHYDCDCPYDDLCKHIVATLYAIRDAHLVLAKGSAVISIIAQA